MQKLYNKLHASIQSNSPSVINVPVESLKLIEEYILLLEGLELIYKESSDESSNENERNIDHSPRF